MTSSVSLGTFVFTFIPHHTIDLTFDSLQPKYRNSKGWNVVSSFSLLIAVVISLTLGIFVYITFWEQTKSDVFSIYPPSVAVNAAKLFLCGNMLLTFALPFIACREMMITLMSNCSWCGKYKFEPQELGLRESLLTIYELDGFGGLGDVASLPSTFFDPMLPDGCDLFLPLSTHRAWLVPGTLNQLTLPYHLLLTLFLWGATVTLALTAPNLGDVLDLVGSISGSLIGFLLPGLFSLRLLGYSHMAATMVLVGCTVGGVGTFFSIEKLIQDL